MSEQEINPALLNRSSHYHFPARPQSSRTISAPITTLARHLPTSTCSEMASTMGTYRPMSQHFDMTITAFAGGPEMPLDQQAWYTSIDPSDGQYTTSLATVSAMQTSRDNSAWLFPFADAASEASFVTYPSTVYPTFTSASDTSSSLLTAQSSPLIKMEERDQKPSLADMPYLLQHDMPPATASSSSYYAPSLQRRSPEHDAQWYDASPSPAPLALTYSGFRRKSSPRIRVKYEPEATPRRSYANSATSDIQCHICRQRFKRIYNLKAHLKIHDTDRPHPYVCHVEECPKTFVRAADLRRHVDSVHSKVKRYPCLHCSARFTRKDTAARHMEDGCPSKKRQLRD